MTKPAEPARPGEGAAVPTRAGPASMTAGARERRPRAEAKSGSAARKRPPLSKPRILAAALRLVDEAGLAGLTIRRLGAALGCEAMSIYHHFPSKRHLTDALIEHALAGIPEPPDVDPVERLRHRGREFLAMARRHARLVPLIAMRRLDAPGGLAWRERALRDCAAALPDARLAAQAFRAYTHYVTGAALDVPSAGEPGAAAAAAAAAEAIASPYPGPAGPAPPQDAQDAGAAFELGLEMLLAGIAGLRPPTPRAPSAVKPIVRPKR